jgi:hypothetical protein
VPRFTFAVVNPPNEVAAHLSPTAQKFLDYIAGDLELTRKLEHVSPGGYIAPLQSWPTFVGGEKLAEIRRATVDLTRLVKSVPERIFDNDVRRITAFYGFPDEALTAILLEPPDGLDGVLVRNDFIDSPEGFKLLEMNAGIVGGWQHRYLEQRLLAHPVIARFLAADGIRPYFRDPLATLLEVVIGDNLGKPTAATGALNVAIALSEHLPSPGEHERLSRSYRDLLAGGGTGLTGEVVLCSCADLVSRQDQVWYLDRLPLHALVLMSSETPPRFVFRLSRRAA